MLLVRVKKLFHQIHERDRVVCICLDIRCLTHTLCSSSSSPSALSLSFVPFHIARSDPVMPSDSLDRSMSSLSLASTDSQPEDDWDHSLIHDLESSSLAAPLELSTADSTAVSQLSGSTPRNSVVFPSEETPSRARRYISNQETGLHSRSASVDVLDGCVKKRTLSDLLKLHSENGSNGDISVEEAKRIADVLGQWVGSSNFSRS